MSDDIRLDDVRRVMTSPLPLPDRKWRDIVASLLAMLDEAAHTGQSAARVAELEGRVRTAEFNAEAHRQAAARTAAVAARDSVDQRLKLARVGALADVQRKTLRMDALRDALGMTDDGHAEIEAARGTL